MRLFEQTGRTSLRRPLPAGHQARAQGQVQEAHALQMPLLFFFIPFSPRPALTIISLPSRADSSFCQRSLLGNLSLR